MAAERLSSREREAARGGDGDDDAMSAEQTVMEAGSKIRIISTSQRRHAKARVSF